MFGIKFKLNDLGVAQLFNTVIKENVMQNFHLQGAKSSCQVGLNSNIVNALHFLTYLSAGK